VVAVVSLTSVQRSAVLHDGNLALVSCPGSGKTRAIVAKLARCASEVAGTPRAVACITYTNAAVHEIEGRLAQLDIPGIESLCEVETVHSFCLKHILGPHGWRLPAFRGGLRLLTPDDDDFAKIVKEIVTSFHLDRRRAPDEFEQLARGIPRSPESSITGEAAAFYWKYLDSHGMTDFSGIVYWSHVLLGKHQYLARGLASRYAWFLVDEFQDTSPLQVDILKAIHSAARSRFFVVGDPFQSIMSVNGAAPTLMPEFAAHVGARQDLELLENFRSTRSILALADRLCDRGEPMKAAAAHRDYQQDPEWHQVPSMEFGVRDVFIPALKKHGIPEGEAAVLAPWWTSLPPLARALRGAGVSVIGPGARPYKRSSHLLAPLAEELAALVAEPVGRGIGHLRYELRRLLSTLRGADVAPTGFREDVLVVGLIAQLRARAHSLDSAAVKLIDDVGKITSVALRRDGLVSESEVEALERSSLGLQSDVRAYEQKVHIPTTVRHLGWFAKGSSSLRLSTMHAAKGREWNAVAVIEAFDGRVPHFSYTEQARSPESREAVYEEGRRVFYVSLTRAKRLLMIFTLSEPDWNTKHSPFLDVVFPSGPTGVHHGE